MASGRILGTKGPLPPLDVHLLPCSIERDGRAKVNEYFGPTIAPDCGQAGRDFWQTYDARTAAVAEGGGEVRVRADGGSGGRLSAALQPPTGLVSSFRGRELRGTTVQLPAEVGAAPPACRRC